MATATEPEVAIDEETPPPGLLAAMTAEYPDEEYEVVDGRIVEEPFLGAYESWSQNALLERIILFGADRRLGRLYVETLFILQAEPRLRRRPDLAYVSAARWPIDKPAPREAAWGVIPDLAIEIVSPTDLIVDLMNKISEYFCAGARAVWVIHPLQELIYDYRSPRSVEIFGRGDRLAGGSVLPGFEMAVDDLFGSTTQGEPTPAA